MFLTNSRYFGLATDNVRDGGGRTVSALRLRRLSPSAGEPSVVRQGTRLDVLSQDRYKDGTRFWHIADANTELEANALVNVAGRSILVPER